MSSSTRSPRRLPPEVRTTVVGRDAEIGALLAVQRSLAGYGPGDLVVIEGARGAGKTCLLGAVHERICHVDWWPAYRGVADPTQFPELIVELLADAVAGVSQQRPGAGSTLDMQAIVVSLAASIGAPSPFDVAPHVGVATAADLRNDVEDVLARLGALFHELGSGLFLLLDDAHRARPAHVEAVLGAASSVSRSGLPVVLVASRLPGPPFAVLHQVLALDPLSPEAVATIVREVELARGGEWRDDAIATIVELAGGNPMLAGCYARAAARVAPGDRVGAQAVLATRTEAEEGLALELLPAGSPRELSRLPGPQRRFLVAVADLGGLDVGLESIARHLGDTTRLGGATTTVARTAEALIAAGLLSVNADNEVSFPFNFVGRLVDALR
ncbi:MAG: ATP-binding protein [Acidimicrobiia bacterium]|nr:ATP-binding protein [Acidimicrobiia bacterium]